VDGDQFHVREISYFDGGTLMFLVVCNDIGQNEGPGISGLTLEDEILSPYEEIRGPLRRVRGANGNVDEPDVQKYR
jgi:hypothetical protein